MNLKTLLPALAVLAVPVFGSAQTTIVHRHNGITVIRKVVHPRRRVVYARHRPHHRRPRVIVVRHPHHRPY